MIELVRDVAGIIRDLETLHLIKEDDYIYPNAYDELNDVLNGRYGKSNYRLEADYQKNYDEDMTFRKVANDLDLPTTTLMKYTTKLESRAICIFIAVGVFIGRDGYFSRCVFMINTNLVQIEFPPIVLSALWLIVTVFNDGSLTNSIMIYFMVVYALDGFCIVISHLIILLFLRRWWKMEKLFMINLGW